jgi:ATPase subunit of ABC transporter with duplicated ATPase domains
MFAFLTLDSVSVQMPEHQTLVSDLAFSLGAERIGLVGRNGSGKFTLIRIIAGEAEPAVCTVLRSGTIGILAQEWPENLTLARVLGVAEGLEVLQRLLSSNGSAEDFDCADWTLEPRVETVLADVGLRCRADRGRTRRGAALLYRRLPSGMGQTAHPRGTHRSRPGRRLRPRLGRPKDQLRGHRWPIDARRS